jgi:hypothetical protein
MNIENELYELMCETDIATDDAQKKKQEEEQKKNKKRE